MSEQAPQEQSEQNTDNSTTEFSSGQVLANARQSLGISLEDLSEQIRVPLKVLQQIEADDLPKNLPETFVRGYIRSYAKKVGVDEGLVLTEVETMGASSADAMEMHSFSKRSKRKRTERRLTIISWGIVAVLAIALVAWWVQTKGTEMFGSGSTTDSELSTQVTAEQQDSSTDSTQNASQLNSLETEESGAEAEETAVEQNTAQLQSQAQTQGQAQVASQLTVRDDSTPQVAEPVESPNTQNSTVTSNEATESQALTEISKADEEQAPIVLSDAEKRLLADNGEIDESDFIKVEFEFENDCWVEVYDAFEERIAIGNKNAGYVMTLNAQGPFRVLLGNPDGVSIWVNGNPYDMSHLPKNRVARFEVDANL